MSARDQVRLLKEEEAAKRLVAWDMSPADPGYYQALQDWQITSERLEKQRLEMQVHFASAIEKTVIRYGISPSAPSGQIRGGPLTNGQAQWFPKYVFRESPTAPVIRRMALPNAAVAYGVWVPDPELTAGAYTWPDGRVDILDSVLDEALALGTPRLLGLTLHHESVHFDQLLRGQWASSAQREVTAYRESLAAADRFGLTKEERNNVRNALRTNIRRVQRQGTRQDPTPPAVLSPEDQEVLKGDWEQLEASFEAVRNQREALKKNIENERAARANDRDAANSGNQAAPWRQYHALKSTARSICESIDFLQQWFGTIDDWKAGLKAVPDTLYVHNLDAVSRTYPCEEYVMFQGIYAFRKGYDVSDLEFLTRLVREGKIRETDSRPYQARVTPAPTQPAPTPPSSAPAAPPIAVYPEPRPTRPEPPSIPHCRYHPWCKE